MFTPYFTLSLLLILIHSPLNQLLNVDLSSRITYNGDDNSYFGYSVALSINNFRGNKLFVGAPKATTDALSRFNVTNSGAIYRCDIDSVDCRVVSVDDRPTQLTDYPGYENLTGEDRNNQFFGASVASSRDGSVIAACAPLYVTFGPRGNKREPTGDCFISKDLGGSFLRVSPCLREFDAFYRAAYRNISYDKGWASYHKTGHGMCGFSAALGPDNELAIGAPGNYYFHGALYSVNPVNDYMRFISTRDGPTSDDNNYLSWDLKFGEFDGDNTTIDYVNSAPRANMLKGKILLWSKTAANSFRSLVNISGEQSGAYFGYSIAVGKFNGESGGKYDDIVVSAPLYANYEADMSELGQVTVFSHNMSTSQTVFFQSAKITGEDAYGRFGLALANVGDLNKDGFDELMVSAPYGGPDKRGVVFLYHGSETGLITTPVQVIYAEDVSATNPPNTFGWSITGKLDIDSNLYDDVAIGAYKSNQAFLFKTRPLINLVGSLEIDNDEIQLPVACADNDQTWSLNDLKFAVTFCIHYEAVLEPEEIYLQAVMIFDSANNKTKRGFSAKSGTSVEQFEFSLKKFSAGDEALCSTVEGYVQPTIRDKTSPLNISMEFHLINVSSSGLLSPDPIINHLRPPMSPVQIRFTKSCNLCTPDLKVSASTPSRYYLLGSEEKINLTVKLSNEGEDSYITSVNISLPQDVSYVHVVLDKDECLPISCQQKLINETASNHITCDVGNPFPSLKRSEFTIELRLDGNKQSDETELLFTINAYSNYAQDSFPDDNSFNLSIPLQVKTSVNISGTSTPDDIITYNRSSTFLQQGPLVEHKYVIYTSGPSLVGKCEVEIDWPLYNIAKDDYILYVYKDIAVVQGEATCEVPTRFLNPQNVSVDETRYKRDYSPTEQLTCSNGKASCAKITCTLPNLNKETVILKIYSFLWLGSTTNNLTNNYTTELAISSAASVKVLSVPYTVKPAVYSSDTSTITSFFEKYKPPVVVKPIDWKWIAIGVGCGFLLLIIIIIVLWLCGFFKRYRPYAEAKVVKQQSGQPHETERLCESY